MVFNPNKPVQTRDGRKARIICTDRNNGLYPVVALLGSCGGKESMEAYTADGRWEAHSSLEHPHDLINILEVRTLWVNIYANDLGAVFDAKPPLDTYKESRLGYLEIIFENNMPSHVILHGAQE